MSLIYGSFGKENLDYKIMFKVDNLGCSYLFLHESVLHDKSLEAHLINACNLLRGSAGINSELRIVKQMQWYMVELFEPDKLLSGGWKKAKLKVHRFPDEDNLLPADEESLRKLFGS